MKVTNCVIIEKQILEIETYEIQNDEKSFSSKVTIYGNLYNGEKSYAKIEILLPITISDLDELNYVNSKYKITILK